MLGLFLYEGFIMSDTLPNVVVPPKTVVNLYTAAGIAVGTQIDVKMISNGNGLLYAGAALAGKPDDLTGYRPIRPDEEWRNDSGDSGAFIWSEQGCTVNVKEA